jgi:hypothetical protein
VFGSHTQQYVPDFHPNALRFLLINHAALSAPARTIPTKLIHVPQPLCNPSSHLKVAHYLLSKSDIDLNRAQIHIGRGKSAAAQRTLDMTSETGSILARRMQGRPPWLFPSKRKPGEPLGRLDRTHDRLVEAASKDNITINCRSMSIPHGAQESGNAPL